MNLNIWKTAFAILCLIELTQAVLLRILLGSVTQFFEVQLSDPIPILQYFVHNQTTVIVGGYHHKMNGPYMQKICEAFLANNDTNVCVLNWEKEAECRYLGDADYPCVVENVEVVGKQFGVCLVNLTTAGNMSLENLQLMGHSLGAHVLGNTGRTVKSSGYILPKICGLDPARPGYEGPFAKTALSRHDAAYVETIHTDPGGYGVKSSDSTVKFFPNTIESGSQNGCPNGTDALMSKDAHMCSHTRAIDYASESVRNRGSYQAVQATSFQAFSEGLANYGTVINMPTLSDLGVEGTFYLRTNDKPPYGLYYEGTQPN